MSSVTATWPRTGGASQRGRRRGRDQRRGTPGREVGERALALALRMVAADRDSRDALLGQLARGAVGSVLRSR
jgi:hypothetical protein